MKRLIIILAAGLLAGCASAPAPTSKPRELASDSDRYETASASALAFDVPIFAGFTLPGLDRTAREPGAFLGFQETITESFTVGFEDHQSRDPLEDTFDRWSYSEKSGVRYR